MNQDKNKKPESIQELFGSISSTYDKANDVITLGMAHRWRQRLVHWSYAQKGDAVLDVATGTGDLALEFKKVVGDNGSVVGVDFCKEMLDLAPQKAARLNLDVDFQMGDATQLQFEDESFDITSMAYGIRNVSDPHQALKELARVTRPGGRVMILETGANKNPLVQKGIDFYCRVVMPKLGGWVSGHREAYEYLNNSSSQFPSGDDFVEMVMSTGAYEKVDVRPILGGASFIYRCSPKRAQS